MKTKLSGEDEEKMKSHFLPPNNCFSHFRWDGEHGKEIHKLTIFGLTKTT